MSTKISNLIPNQQLGSDIVMFSSINCGLKYSISAIFLEKSGILVSGLGVWSDEQVKCYQKIVYDKMGKKVSIMKSLIVSVCCSMSVNLESKF